MYYNELYHHGRLGQKKGVRNGPPYPLSRGVVKKAYGRKRGISGYLQARREKKELKRLSEEEKKASERRKAEEEEKARRDADRERVLKEGTATEVFQYKNELSPQELSQALNRIKWTNELARLASEESDKGWKTIDQVMKKVGNVKDWTRTGVDFYKVLNEAIELVNKEKK